MSQSPIREYNAKKIIKQAIDKYSNGTINFESRSVLVTSDNSFDDLAKENSWLVQERLVVKPDQLFGKRGKHGLVGLNLDYQGVQNWIKEKTSQKVTVSKSTGELTHFIIDPFIPHEKEYYIAIKSEQESDIIYFSREGGVDIEENWEDKVIEIKIGVLENIDDVNIDAKIDEIENKDLIVNFIKTLFKIYVDYNFAYLEINPFAVKDNIIIPLDVVAKLDDTAAFESAADWGEIEFPVPFGREFLDAEKYIKKLDSKTGASLKLTILNPQGKIWTMVAGGGASVIYADTISDLGMGKEMANYGEYSGNPNTEETYEYAKTLLDLMTREKADNGKVLIIGGGIANFTDVAKTFTGIIQALGEYKEKLIKNYIKIYVRRGGPNYEQGLKMIEDAGKEMGVPIEVYGPETHMTEVVNIAITKIQANSNNQIPKYKLFFCKKRSR